MTSRTQASPRFHTSSITSASSAWRRGGFSTFPPGGGSGSGLITVGSSRRHRLTTTTTTTAQILLLIVSKERAGGRADLLRCVVDELSPRRRIPSDRRSKPDRHVAQLSPLLRRARGGATAD